MNVHSDRFTIPRALGDRASPSHKPRAADAGTPHPVAPDAGRPDRRQDDADLVIDVEEPGAKAGADAKTVNLDPPAMLSAIKAAADHPFRRHSPDMPPRSAWHAGGSRVATTPSDITLRD